jgi:hypothetical protein
MREKSIRASAEIISILRAAKARPPIGYRIGQLAPWGCWLNWCPGGDEWVEDGQHAPHLWSSVDEQPAQGGDGVCRCPDADGLPNHWSPEVGRLQAWAPDANEDDRLGCAW